MLDLSQPKYAHAVQRLRENVIAWLGTVRPDGRPHLVPIWYLWDGESFLIFSMPEKQKVKNIRHDPRVTLALDDTDDGDDVIIVEGRAELLPEPAIKIVPQAYYDKYGEGIKALGYTNEQMLSAYSQAIRVTPERLTAF